MRHGHVVSVAPSMQFTRLFKSVHHLIVFGSSTYHSLSSCEGSFVGACERNVTCAHKLHCLLQREAPRHSEYRLLDASPCGACRVWLAMIGAHSHSQYSRDSNNDRHFDQRGEASALPGSRPLWERASIKQPDLRPPVHRTPTRHFIPYILHSSHYVVSSLGHIR